LVGTGLKDSLRGISEEEFCIGISALLFDVLEIFIFESKTLANLYSY
jgi:hypothetical protein